jgi:tRNA A-37 threonylcarbamoyl transferase component Bud32
VAKRLHAVDLVHKDFGWRNLLWARVASEPFVIDMELATGAGQQVWLPIAPARVAVAYRVIACCS